MLIVLIFTWICLLLCVYTYIGYPLLLGILAKLRPNPVKYGDATPPVSLIIAAYNEQDFLAEKLENSLALDYPREQLQIMVVSDGSTDDTPALVETYADRGILSLYTPERGGKAKAINRGVEHATGEILVFSDANANYNAQAIRYLIENFNDPQVGCVSGKKTVVKSESAIGDSEGLYWKYESFIKKSESLIHSSTGVVGEMTAIRRELFTPIPPNISVDDAYLALSVMRKGYRVIYEHRAFSWETPAISTRDEIIRRQRINAGRYHLFSNPRQVLPWNNPLVLFKLVSHKVMRLLLPFFMIGAFLGNALLMLFPSAPFIMTLIFIAQLAFYGLAFIGYLAEKQGRNPKLPKVAYYLVSSNYAGLQGFIRFIKMRGQHSGVWEKASRAKAS